MRIISDTKYNFDDMLILPKRSDLSSRSEVSLKRQFSFPFSTLTTQRIPIMAANMDNIGTFKMASTLNDLQLMTALGKHYDAERLIQFFKSIESDNYGVFYSMGTSTQDIEKFEKVRQQVYLPFINIDVANGYTQNFLDFVKNFRKEYGNDPKYPICIMAGNVVTPDITQDLILNGKVDIVKVGIGGGALCTTRKKTGIGYPQLSAVIECADAAHQNNALVCSDGGCVVPGDVAKALGGGSDFVMLGSMLAGHEEGLDEHSEIVEEEGKQYIKIYGMSSSSAMKKHYGKKENYRSSEGREVLMPFKGHVANTVEDILGGLRSTCTYIGAKKIKEIPKRTNFVKVNNQLNQSLSNLKQE